MCMQHTRVKVTNMSTMAFYNWLHCFAAGEGLFVVALWLTLMLICCCLQCLRYHQCLLGFQDQRHPYCSKNASLGHLSLVAQAPESNPNGCSQFLPLSTQPQALTMVHKISTKYNSQGNPACNCNCNLAAKIILWAIVYSIVTDGFVIVIGAFVPGETEASAKMSSLEILLCNCKCSLARNNLQHVSCVCHVFVDDGTLTSTRFQSISCG